MEALQGYNDYRFNQNSVLANYDILGMNTVVVSGGINTNRDVDGRHDANWRNFISSASMRIRALKESCPNEKIEWFVNKSSYEKRAFNDLSSWDTLVLQSAHTNPNVDVDWNSRIRYHTIMEIESLAKELKVSLRWYNSKYEFEQLLRLSPQGMTVRRGCSKIDKFIYYGHGYVGKLAIIYGGGKDIQEVTIDESSFDSAYFANNPYIDLVTCHSASRPKKNPEKGSLAEEINLKLGGIAYGYDGRVDYAPVYEGKMPKEGASINGNEAIIDPNRYHTQRFFKARYDVERKDFGSKK